MKKLNYFLAGLFLNLISLCSFAQTDSSLIENLIKNVEIDGQWFMGYQRFDTPEEEYNLFTLKRGYLTFRTNITNRISVNYTQDITLDTEGDDAGNMEFRLKYLYLKLDLDDIGFVTKPFFEFGLVRKPWISFEQGINPYRVQGAMFTERNTITNSADYGITFTTLLGGEMDEQFQQNVSDKLPGRYGSFSIGVYNGPGYSQLEQNNNKTVEGRLSIRPLPDHIPGLQASYNIVLGKGNIPSEPDLTVNTLMLSYQEAWGTLTGQYYTGKGNARGTMVNAQGEAYKNNGYSFFGELFVPGTDVALFGRYDRFTSQREEDLISKRIIAGLSYYFHQDSKIIVDMDLLSPDGGADYSDKLFEVVLEVLF